ncbi:hypothetical protein ABPG75_012887 [Micractinium tetrahymenae]
MLPRVAQAVRGMARTFGAQLAERIVACLEPPSRPTSPDAFMEHVPPVTSTAQLRSLLAAADAALRLLPLLQGPRGPAHITEGMLRRMQQNRLQAGEQAAYPVSFLSMVVASFVAGALRQAHAHVGQVSVAGISEVHAGGGGTQHVAAELAKAAPEALALHLSACRLVHWAASLSTSHREALAPCLAGWEGVLETVCSACQLAKSALLLTRHAAAGPVEHEAADRHVGAAHAALWEALLVLKQPLGAPSFPAPERPLGTPLHTWACALMDVAACCPALLRGGALLQELVLAAQAVVGGHQLWWCDLHCAREVQSVCAVALWCAD